MKKVFILLLTLIFFGCSNYDFIGYLVAKEHTPERMCCDETKTICYGGYVPVIRPHKHKHKKELEVFTVYLANKESIRKINVSKETFSKMKLGKKYVIKSN